MKRIFTSAAASREAWIISSAASTESATATLASTCYPAAAACPLHATASAPQTSTTTASNASPTIQQVTQPGRHGRYTQQVGCLASVILIRATHGREFGGNAPMANQSETDHVKLNRSARRVAAMVIQRGRRTNPPENTALIWQIA